MHNDPPIRLSVVIPAYNEESRLPNTLDHTVRYLTTQPYGAEIIVVDDGSTDGTARVVRNQDPGSVTLTLITHEDGANHGKGASVQRGMMHARGDFRLFMDADNSTTIDQMERFWPFFARGFDVVIGSRALKDSVIGVRQARLKEIAGRLGNWLIRALTVPGIRDTQAGFKAFSAAAAEDIFRRQTIQRWGYDIELLVIARNLGYRVCEVPIVWLNAQGSKVTARAYLQVMSDVLRIRRNLKKGVYGKPLPPSPPRSS